VFSVRVAEKEQGGQWSFAVGAQMANSHVGPLGAKPLPVKDFFWVFWCLQSAYSATLLRVNRCRSPSIWQQMQGQKWAGTRRYGVPADAISVPADSASEDLQFRYLVSRAPMRRRSIVVV